MIYVKEKSLQKRKLTELVDPRKRASFNFDPVNTDEYLKILGPTLSKLTNGFSVTAPIGGTIDTSVMIEAFKIYKFHFCSNVNLAILSSEFLDIMKNKITCLELGAEPGIYGYSKNELLFRIFWDSIEISKKLDISKSYLSTIFSGGEQSKDSKMWRRRLK